jgi:peroxiredoxin
MSEYDSVAVLLKTLDRPVEPRPEFSDGLRQRLLTELGETNGHRTWMPHLQLPPRPQRRHRLLAVALAIVLVASALAVVLLSRPAPASALDLIRQAQHQAASLPPFEATVRYDINPDGSMDGVPKGATQTWQVSYVSPKRLRTSLIGAHLPVPGARAVGSYDVVNGNNAASYDPRHKRFDRFPLSPYTRPLADLAWQGGYPNWERICRGPAAQVLPNAVVAGRDARHVRCSDATGNVWQLWIDRQTGLLLKLKGQTGGGGDFFLESVPLTSQQGGFTVTRLRLHPSFPTGAFKGAAPSGALDYVARLRGAEAKLPSLQAIITTRAHGHTQTELELWWQNAGTWRANYLAGGGILGGPGSFEVAAHGKVGEYNAHDNSYSTMATPKSPNVAPNPIVDLLPEDDPRYPSTCTTVGRGRIDRQPAIEHRCWDYRIWVDARTGLTLQSQSIKPGYQFQVSNLRYDPVFRAGTFHFARPRGSRSATQLANDPYYKTRLKPGRLAPNWQARMLDGGSFQITNLRGKPALLLFFSDGCGATCITTNVYTPLERLYRETRNKLAIVWVDVFGQGPAQARKVVRHNNLTFPVVTDPQGPGINHSNSERAWNYQAYPYWVLLDSHGRLIEARFKPQTLTELRQLVNEAK